jgi:hypothetical protein
MKHDLNQLMLDFENGGRMARETAELFGRGMDALQELQGSSAIATGTTSYAEERRVVNRLVGALAAQSGLTFAVVWVLAYHALCTKNGFHAVVASGGKGAHLDAVANAGYLPVLRDVLLEMLVDPQYKAGGGR